MWRFQPFLLSIKRPLQTMCLSYSLSVTDIKIVIYKYIIMITITGYH